MTDLFEEKEISPMLLGEEKEPFDDREYIYELKLDGIRCIAYLEKGKATLRNKRNKDVTDIYPELSEIWRTANQRCILDGELVAFTDGKPDFYALQKRSLMTDSFPNRDSGETKPRPVCGVRYFICRQKENHGQDARRAEEDPVRYGQGRGKSKCIAMG